MTTLATPILDSPVVPSGASCDHCGDPCGTQAVASDEGLFCCTGCESVFAVLHANGLEAFYACDITPGVSQRASVDPDASRFAALDEPNVRSRFVDCDDGGLATARFLVPGIHCASCLWLLERLGRVNAAIVRTDVDVVRRTVCVTFRSDEITLSAVAGELAAIGYAPSTEAEQASGAFVPARRRLYSKLGVAGFAFGNIMLFSIPRYANGAPVDGGFQRLFDVLNLVLSVPVLLFSASEYFEAAWRSARRRTISLQVPVALGLAALFGRSVVDIALGRGPGFLDSFTGLVFFLLVGRLFQQQAFDRIAFDRTYRSFFPLSARVEPDDGPPVTVPIERLRRGDRIIVRSREVVPADAVLLDSTGVLDYAFLTGEEAPLVAQRGEVVRAGGRAVSGALRLRVIREVSQSRLAGLWNNPVFARQKRDRLEDVSSRFGAWFVLIAVGLAVAGAVMWWPDSTRSLDVFTAVLIIACPCALTLAAPVALGTAMTVLGRSGCFLKQPAVALTLSRVDTVLFDKTGTLTAADPHNPVRADGLTASDWQLVQQLAAGSVHPASRAVASGVRLAGRREAAEETAGAGVRGRIDGHDVVIGTSRFVSASLGIPVDATRGGAVIAIDGDVRGTVQVPGVLRPGIEAAVSALATTRIVGLISGDQDSDTAGWRGMFGARAWFRQSPEDKLAIVRAHQQGGDVVLMVGDGLNDAGALAAADLGLAISDDTAVIVPACDLILRGNRLAGLPAILDYARSVRHILGLCFVVSVLYNVVGLTLALRGILTPLLAAIFMPVSSLSIIGLSLGLTRLQGRRLMR